MHITADYLESSHGKTGMGRNTGLWLFPVQSCPVISFPQWPFPFCKCDELSKLSSETSLILFCSKTKRSTDYTPTMCHVIATM